MSAGKISIVIVSYNTRDLLRRCLTEAYRHTEDVQPEIFVVDNASSDGSAGMVRAEFPAVRLLENAENAGFARANNQALRLLRSDFALLLNSDAMLKAGSLRALLDFAQARPRAAIVGPRLTDGEGRLQPSTYTTPSPWNEFLKALKLYKLLPAAVNSRLFLSSFFDHRTSRQAARLTGACVLIRKTALDSIGLLPEEFFFYGEVHDWCLTARERGWQVWFCADTEVTHLGGQSSARKWPSPERLAVNLRETDRLLSRHLSMPARWAVQALRLLSAGLALAWRGIAGGSRTDQESTAAIRREAAWLLRRFNQTFSWLLRKSALAKAYYASGLHRRRFMDRLASLTGIPAAHLEASMLESRALRQRILTDWESLPAKPVRTGMLDFASAEIIYALVRELKPGKVIETGVANGISSSYILKAMERNGKGQLISVDCVPDGAPDFLPADRKAGWLVPEGLRGRWKFVEGRTSEKLPPLLADEPGPDIFIHDSEHSYENMLFEYKTAWPRLREGGLLLSDDTGLTFAFEEFAEGVAAGAAVLSDKLGVMRKGRPAR